MEQKIFKNKAHNFDVESLGSEFDEMFDTRSIVDKIKKGQMNNRGIKGILSILIL